MRSLLWKEWHEQSWKLGFGCIVLGALTLIGFRSRILADETMLMWVNFLGLTMLPILAATGLVPAERGEGSLESLLALPVRASRILGVKAAMGIVLCAGPMLVAGAISVFVTRGREISVITMIAFYGSSLVTTLSLFVWMMALTIRLPSETRAALLSIGVLILWMLATEGLAYPSVPKLAMSISPFALVYRTILIPGDPEWIPHPLSGDTELSRIGVVLAAQIAIAFLLWKYASRRVVD
jgi:hypothetical protein